MNPDLRQLHAYPFERLARLLDGAAPPSDREPISLSIGEPRHAPPDFVAEALDDAREGLGRYPMAAGTEALRDACAGWLSRRYGLAPTAVDPQRMVLPVAGTREGLFAFAQACVDRSEKPLVMLPNPFYQIYEGAALLAGAQPYYLDTVAANDFVPDLDAVAAPDWDRCQLVYACSPGNPTGRILPDEFWRQLLTLADRHDFVIAADECYAEIYFEEQAPPRGLLQVCAEQGRDDFARCIVFHSLSKRSNVPGLRSGFVAGDAGLIAGYQLYRTYHGCAVPLPTQSASVLLWADDAHAATNRERYRRKFAACLPVLAEALEFSTPDAAFYVWAHTPGDDEDFARGLYENENVIALPGTYLGRDAHGGNPGKGMIRISLVAESTACLEAARRIVRYTRNQL